MENTLLDLVSTVQGYVWGLPMLVLLGGTGLYLTVLLKGVQFRSLFHALYLALIRRREADAEGDISHFQALMTALAATVGTGNIAGVATAIAAGGPGALFWMWMTGLVGMATKYSEAVLAVKYREKDSKGLMQGGPMYYITNALGWKWLGGAYALFAALAAFGIGNMTQSNSMADVLQSTFGVSPWITGGVLMVGTGLVLIGGIKSIGRAASLIVPTMIVLYILGGLTAIIDKRLRHTGNLRTRGYARLHADRGRWRLRRRDGPPGGPVRGGKRDILQRIRTGQRGYRRRGRPDERSRHAGPGIHDADLHRYPGRVHDHRFH